MAIEHASTEIVRKPWGRHDLRPWGGIHVDGDPVGELWFQRADPEAPQSSLLLKVLFSTERLSVQVHPDDAYAKSVGLANGKTEAWYVLASAPGGEVAVGLKQALTTAQLRHAIADGSIAGMIDWREVHAGDAISVPARTIHAIGAGLVVAEIQQRSDTTFRMFDYGRGRDLQVDAAVAVAEAEPAAAQAPAYNFDGVRTILVASPYFMFERIDLPPQTRWRLNVDGETWLLILQGHARLGSLDAFVGQAFFLDESGERIDVGPAGLSALIAYASTMPNPRLLTDLDQPAGASASGPAYPATISVPASVSPPPRLWKAQP